MFLLILLLGPVGREGGGLHGIFTYDLSNAVHEVIFVSSGSHEQQCIFHQINEESCSYYARPRPALPRRLPAFESRMLLPEQLQKQFERLQISLHAAHMICPEDSQTLRAARHSTAEHVNPAFSTPLTTLSHPRSSRSKDYTFSLHGGKRKCRMHADISPMPRRYCVEGSIFDTP